MLWEPKGCCCFSLRTGSLVLATIVIVFGSLGIINGVGIFIVGDIHGTIREVCEEDKDMDLEECINLTTPIALGILITKFVLDCVQVVFSIFLIHGILKNKTRYMVPYMIMVLVGIIIMMLVALVMIGFFIYIGVFVGVLIFAFIFGLIIFLETYFLLVIRALYLQLKRQKGQHHMVLSEHGYGKANTEADYPEYH
ncbi:lysosomal-associated transmembrane protein 5-like [Penaeus japonicus]|uniref:lysosomal-associated transmembrane protein 5-like n=1 Tax=Penaeus japonicus TaxID=27405 RepID=UPI001C711B9C|nr:lysosomal-associated transmembrane protein 5-like [Penaeus japonicus]